MKILQLYVEIDSRFNFTFYQQLTFFPSLLIITLSVYVRDVCEVKQNLVIKSTIFALFFKSVDAKKKINKFKVKKKLVFTQAATHYNLSMIILLYFQESL